ncbi:hypothetical protein RN001_007021 [Aquatica leii]|uniref:MORN repeat-containing protein 5 n=1 Tax=Aquatica leii TaxID=1421715 RepID=A0AAN7Q6M2_9COLE|nr:hypothetical protein RN001_007021 [Aquatica leii]
MANRRRVVSLSVDWDNVIGKLGEDKKREMMHTGHIVVNRLSHKHCTKSIYTGQWNVLGMHGKGNFMFPHDVEYEGNLRDGMFHGDGTLTYPMGQKLEGTWNKGKLVDYKFSYSDNLDYTAPWDYCQMPDRRFFKCVEEGLRPAGRSLLTNSETARRIPKGCYDTGDGYYNPKTKCVMSAITPGKIIRIPTSAEETWIQQHCRKAWDEPTGYRPDLYEHWVTGRKSDSVLLDSEISVSDAFSDSSGGTEDSSYNKLNDPTFKIFAKDDLDW